MLSNKDFQKALGLINNANNVLITTHTRPDGDACGSLVALDHALTDLGKKTTQMLLTELPEWYAFLFTEKPKAFSKDISVEQLLKGKFDLVILLDVNSKNQLQEISEFLKHNDKPVLVIDHHVTNDGLGDTELIDITAAATGLIILDLLKYAKCSITKKIAEALFVAVSTDTGWFHFSNTDGRTYSAAAELTAAGAKPAKIYHDIYQNLSVQRFKLMSLMLETLKLHLDGRYATQQILQSDFDKTGAVFKDTENLIDECQRIGTVQAAALFVELADGKIKCSLRSSPRGEAAGRGAIDVSKIAQKYGGGGHPMASGAHLKGPLEEAKQSILAEVTEQFAKLDRK